MELDSEFRLKNKKEFNYFLKKNPESLFGQIPGKYLSSLPLPPSILEECSFNPRFHVYVKNAIGMTLYFIISRSILSKTKKKCQTKTITSPRQGTVGNKSGS